MKIKNIYCNDFINFGGHCSLTIAMPYCSFKCGKELCQNSPLAKSPIIDISIDTIIEKFMESDLMDAVVFQGLEPFDSWEELQSFILNFRYRSPVPIVIYTGYNLEELKKDWIDWLKLYSEDGPIIIKFGRYIPNQKPHYDPILKVNLASDNQYAIEVKNI